MKIFPLFLVVVTCIFSGCATTYDSSSLLSGGYSETKLGVDVIRIVFRGNSSTTKERAQDLALLRAADLSLQAGFPYFQVLEETNDINRRTSDGITIGMPRSEILVHFLKGKPAGVLTFDASFLAKTMREKYNVK